MTKKPGIYLLPALLALGITGCAGAPDSGDDAIASSDTPETSPQVQQSDDVASIAHITDCSQVESVVHNYIEGLVPSESNEISEWGVYCGWEPSETETDWANIRSVSVSLNTLEEGAEKPDPELVIDMLGGTLIENDWVEQQGGIAYTVGIGAQAVGAIVTTVWVPGVEMTFGGGAWEGFQAFDGVAAADAAVTLLTQK